MIKVLFGEEPYMIDNTIKAAKDGLGEMNIINYDTLDNEVVTRAIQYPFFSNKQVIIVRPTTLGTFSNDILRYFDKPEDFTDLFIIPEQIDKRTSAFQECKKRGFLQECNKLTDSQLQTFILTRIKNASQKITADSYNYLVERSGYRDDPDVTLYALEIYLKQFSFHAEDEITCEVIDALVEKSITQKTFVLSTKLLQGETNELFQLAGHFISEGESVIGMLSLLLRVFRLAYKATLCKEKSPQEIGKLLGVPTYQFKDALKYEPAVISDALELIQGGVNDIKGGKAPARVIFIKCLGEVISELKK